MSNASITSLADCTEFRQSIMARPPRVIHATALLLATLLAAAFVWAGLTEADLVVRAAGRVRPQATSGRPADAASEESAVAPLHGGRVVEVHVREGQRVAKGDLLVRFDDRELQNDIAKHERSLASARDELERLGRMERLLAERHAAAAAKAAAELRQVRQDVERAARRRTTDIEIARVKAASTRDTVERLAKLRTTGAVTAQEIHAAESAYREALLELKNAGLPVDEERVQVARDAVDLVRRERRVEASEHEMKRAEKQSEIASLELELANLRLLLDQATLTAPSCGVVSTLGARVGDVFDPGETALTIVDQSGLRLDVELAAADVGMIREGMPVRVKLDAFDYQKYGTAEGRVVYVAPDSEINEQESNGAAAPTFTVKVALACDHVGRGDVRGDIKLGMTGQAEIITDQESLLTLLVRSFRRSISLG